MNCGRSDFRLAAKLEEFAHETIARTPPPPQQGGSVVSSGSSPAPPCCPQRWQAYPAFGNDTGILLAADVDLAPGGGFAAGGLESVSGGNLAGVLVRGVEVGGTSGELLWLSGPDQWRVQPRFCLPSSSVCVSLWLLELSAAAQ